MTASTTNSINNATQSLQLLSNTGILDPNGNVLLSVFPVGSAINNLVLSNAASGFGPTLLTTSNGSDANVDLNISCKGTGKINLGPASTTSLTAIAGNVIQFNNTANTYSATLNASTCTSNANYTLPVAAPGGTALLSSTSGGAMSWVATTGSDSAVLATNPQFTNNIGVGVGASPQVGLNLIPTIFSTTDGQPNTILLVSGFFNLSAAATNNNCYGISIFTVTNPNAGSITNYYGISSQALITNSTAITTYYGGYFANPVLGTSSGTITNTVALYANNMAIGVTATTPPNDGLIVSGPSNLKGGIIGVSNASAATAGNVGEEISSVIADASHISLSTGATTTITSISLTAGDWLVYGNVSLANSNGSIGEAYGWTTTTALTGENLPDTSVSTIISFSSGAAFNIGLVCPFLRVNVNTTTTVYLQARSTFIAGTTYATGGLYAMRNR